MIYVRDDSVMLVNRSKVAKTKLEIINRINMLLTPYKIAVPIFFDSMATLSLPWLTGRNRFSSLYKHIHTFSF